MTAPPPFFFPNQEGPAGEQAYDQLRCEVEAEMGRSPSRRRILELWTRRGSLDCVTTVGAPDPIWGDVVIAIFDMGPGQPFVVYRQHPADPLQHVPEVLRSSAYAVGEFAP